MPTYSKPSHPGPQDPLVKIPETAGVGCGEKQLADAVARLLACLRGRALLLEVPFTPSEFQDREVFSAPRKPGSRSWPTEVERELRAYEKRVESVWRRTWR